MNLDAAFAALSDPTRRAVFEAVRHQPKAVGVLAENLPVTRPAVSQHLKVLSDAGLVTVQSKGTFRIYSARRDGLAELRNWLETFWDDVLTEFAVEVSKQKGRSID